MSQSINSYAYADGNGAAAVRRKVAIVGAGLVCLTLISQYILSARD